MINHITGGRTETVRDFLLTAGFSLCIILQIKEQQQQINLFAASLSYQNNDASLWKSSFTGWRSVLKCRAVLVWSHFSGLFKALFWQDSCRETVNEKPTLTALFSWHKKQVFFKLLHASHVSIHPSLIPLFISSPPSFSWHHASYWKHDYSKHACGSVDTCLLACSLPEQLHDGSFLHVRAHKRLWRGCDSPRGRAARSLTVAPLWWIACYSYEVQCCHCFSSLPHVLPLPSLFSFLHHFSLFSSIFFFPLMWWIGFQPPSVTAISRRSCPVLPAACAQTRIREEPTFPGNGASHACNTKPVMEVAAQTAIDEPWDCVSQDTQTNTNMLIRAEQPWHVGNRTTQSVFLSFWYFVFAELSLLKLADEAKSESALWLRRWKSDLWMC